MLYLYRKINLCLQDIKYCVNNGIPYEDELVQKITHYFSTLDSDFIDNNKDNIVLLNNLSESLVFDVDLEDLNRVIDALLYLIPER